MGSDKLPNPEGPNDDNPITICNEVVLSFQNEQGNYLHEMGILCSKIKTVFDNPKTGVSKEVVDTMFGNLTDLIKTEDILKSGLDEMKVISSAHDILPFGLVICHLAKVELFNVYIEYSSNYSWALIELGKVKQQKDSLKYSFEDCVRLGFSEDTITILLDVLLFKPIQHISYLFETIRDIISNLKNLSTLSQELQINAALQKELLRDALYHLDSVESSVQDVMDQYYNEYRHYQLYLVPRHPTSSPQLLFKSYVSMIVDQKLELRYLEITEESVTINVLDKENRDKILMRQRYPIGQIVGVKDLHNQINQFSISLKDQVLQLLPAKAEDKDDVVTTLTILLSRRVFLPPTLGTSSPLSEGRAMHSEYDEVFTDQSPEPLLASSLDALVDRLIVGAVTDAAFTRRFLTVFTLFTTHLELLTILQTRFNLNKKESEGSDKTYKLKVLGVLKTWLALDKEHFLRDGLLASNLGIFLDSCKKTPWLVKWVKLLQRGLDHPSTPRSTLSSTGSTLCCGSESSGSSEGQEKDPVMWFLAKEFDKFSLLTLHPIELANQITLIEHSFLKKMKIIEILANKGEEINKLREFQDRYTLWIRRSLVETKNLEERTATFRNVFHILKRLHSIHNYTGLMAVYNVLQSAEIYRLKHSIRKLLFKYKDTMSKVEEISKHHFKKYWEDLEVVDHPTIPLLGLYSRYIRDSELVFVEGDVVNFQTCLRMAPKIEALKLLQQRPYQFEIEHSVKRYLMDLCPYERKTRREFLSSLYDKSLIVEPFGGPPCFFSRTTKYDLSWDPVEFFGWKSTSVKPKSGPSIDKSVEKFNHFKMRMSESEEEEENNTRSRSSSRRGSTLTKSKSFCSRRVDGPPPPLPPRLAAINKSNCLSRSKSFNTENRSPYDLYVLPDRRQPTQQDHIYVTNTPFIHQNSPPFVHNSPLYGHQGRNSPMYGHNSPIYGQNSPIYGQNSPIFRESSPVYTQHGHGPQLYEEMTNPVRNTTIQTKPKQTVRPIFRPALKKGTSSPTSFVRSTQASPSPPPVRRRPSPKGPRPKPAAICADSGSESPPPVLPQKTRNTLRRRAPARAVEYDIPNDESYDTIESYPIRPPPIPPKAYKAPPIPPRS